MTPPDKWEIVPLEDVAAQGKRSITDGPFGSNLKTEHYTAAGPGVVRLQNIGDGVFVDQPAHISAEHYERLQAHNVEAGDVLVAAMGESLPRACVAPAGLGPAIVKADCFRIRVRPDVNPRFVSAMLNSPPVRAEAESQIAGVGRPRLNLGKTRKLHIPLPPKEEQDRIVAAIEEHFSHLDAGVALLERVGRRTRRMRTAILAVASLGSLVEQKQEESSSSTALAAIPRPTAPRRAIAQKPDPFSDSRPSLRELPVGWTWADAADVCELITNGDTPPQKSMTPQGDIPFIKIYNLTFDGRLDFSERPTFIERTTHETQLSRSRLLPGDVLTNIVGPPLGKVAMVPDSFSEWNTNQAVVAFRTYEGVLDPRLLTLWLQTDLIIGLLKSTAKATAGQFNVSLTACRYLPLPIPPRQEQTRLLSKVDALLSSVQMVQEEAGASRVRAASLRRQVLASAFAGQLLDATMRQELVVTS